jgi:SAM-dependent methyltransferase
MDYPWPESEGISRPRWTGNGFLVGGRRVGVLAYGGGESGWSDGLTHMHETWAGADHPIDDLSRNWTISALRRHLNEPTSIVLEVGCSSGFLITALRAEWPLAMVMGSDFLREPLERLAAREPGIPLLQFDLVRCPLPDASIDAIVALNVLEHIKHDRAAVDQVFRILKPGGILAVEVPAGPHLYNAYDEYLQHERRYTASALASLLKVSGLTVLEQSHLGFSVYPAFAMVKRHNQKQAALSSDAKRRVFESNIRQTRGSVLLRCLLQVEAWLGRYCSFPCGIRCVAVARKGRKAPV